MPNTNFNVNHIKKHFIELAIEKNVLQWGKFTLKSGRVSPYFFNMGNFYDGHTLKLIGNLYAQTILAHHIPHQHIFGPAYKGIPLATATAIALSELGCQTLVTFNRKEIKDHGEGGHLMGAPIHINDNILMLDDVITAGTAYRESKQIIQSSGGNLTHILIALDRCEKGQANRSALDEVREQGIQIHSLINFFDLLNYLKQNNQLDQYQKMEKYHKLHGISL